MRRRESNEIATKPQAGIGRSPGALETMLMALGLSEDRVTLVESQPLWADLYQRERALLLELLDVQTVDIQHIGSTSVSGMPAKPILDILVGVESFEEATASVGPMQSIGYHYRGENGIRRRHYFVKGKPRTHHVHMVERNSDVWRQTVRFRDLLRSNSDAANGYALAKRALAERYARDREAYQREKGRVIAQILAGKVNQVADSTPYTWEETSIQ